MVTEKSIFTLTIPHWVSKVRIGTVATLFYTKGDALPQKHEGATLRRAGKKEHYVDSRNKKIVKNPLQKGTPKYWNVNGQAFYSNNMTWKTRSTIVNYYHKYFAKYIKDQFSEPFPTFLSYKLDMYVTVYDMYSKFTPDITNMWILSKMIEDSVVNCEVLRDDSPEFRMRTSIGYRFVDLEEDRKIVVEFKYNKY